MTTNINQSIRNTNNKQKQTYIIHMQPMVRAMQGQSEITILGLARLAWP
jgi:hypothetical protein